MRDPYAPIPGPVSARYWERAAAGPPPPPPRRAVDREPDAFDPVRLLPSTGDRLGIDRRRRPRHEDAQAPPADELLDVVGAAHVRVRRVLGLRMRAGTRGCALVEAISWCPYGILVRAVDPTDPQLSSRGRASAHRAFRTLVPALAVGGPSPLFAAGLAVLSARVVRDLAAWSRPPSTAGRVTARHPVELVLAHERPRAPAAGTPHGTQLSGPIHGELQPLTDPQPEILAIALAAAHAETLRRAWDIADASR